VFDRPKDYFGRRSGRFVHYEHAYFNSWIDDILVTHLRVYFVLFELIRLAFRGILRPAYWGSFLILTVSDG
jgi:hypothetical protein